MTPDNLTLQEHQYRLMMERGCPRHGKGSMVIRDGACYCAHPTPGEMTSICFYHPVNKKEKSFSQNTKNKTPDVMLSFENYYKKRKKDKKYRKLKTIHYKRNTQNKKGIEIQNSRLRITLEGRD